MTVLARRKAPYTELKTATASEMQSTLILCSPLWLQLHHMGIHIVIKQQKWQLLEARDSADICGGMMTDGTEGFVLYQCRVFCSLYQLQETFVCRFSVSVNVRRYSLCSLKQCTIHLPYIAKTEGKNNDWWRLVIWFSIGVSILHKKQEIPS